MNQITFREMQAEDIPAVSALVMGVARAFIWEELSEQGRLVFAEFASIESLAVRRQSAANYGLLAIAESRPIGMIELRGWSHITLFFIEATFHKRGIGRELMQRALNACQQNAPFIRRVTVGASLYGAPFYEKLGFVRTGPQQQENGIRYIPMMVDLPVVGEGNRQNQLP